MLATLERRIYNLLVVRLSAYNQETNALTRQMCKLRCRIEALLIDPKFVVPIMLDTLLDNKCIYGCQSLAKIQASH